MLWSSGCRPVGRRMINQTDWMGQIWVVIAQNERYGLLGCNVKCVGVCECV